MRSIDAFSPRINAVRAISVLAVLLYHINADLFKMGYLGVDAFFVISGYLITQKIRKEQIAGTFSLSKFYLARVSRLAPALWFCIIICIPFSYFLLDYIRYEIFIESALATLINISNIYFWRGFDYFTPLASNQVLIHTWSLSVEEQFYLIFPLVLLIINYYSRSNKVLLVVITSLMLISLMLFVWGESSAAVATFYLPVTRAWEFGVGAICAIFTIHDKNNGNAVKIIKLNLDIIIFLLLSVILLGFIPARVGNLVGTLLTVFLTSIFLLIDNHMDRNQYTVSYLFKNKFTIYCGLMSYSLYLLHQPVIVFVNELVDDKLIGSIFGIFISLCFAYVSWKYVEQKYRYVLSLNKRFKIAFLGLFFVLIGIFCVLYAFKPSYDTEVIKSTARYQNSFSEYWDRYSCKDGELCEVGSVGSAKSILLIGDSHSGALLPLLDEIGVAYDLRVVRLGAGGCPPIFEFNVTRRWDDGQKYRCEELQSNQRKLLESTKFDYVVIASFWSSYLNYEHYSGGTKIIHQDDGLIGFHDGGVQRDNFKLGFEYFLNALKKANTGRIVIIDDVPTQKFDPKILYLPYFQKAINVPESDIIKRSVAAVDNSDIQRYTSSMIQKIAKENQARFVSVDEIFCDVLCLIGNSDVSFYRDDNHLSPAGAIRIKKKLLFAMGIIENE